MHGTISEQSDAGRLQKRIPGKDKKIYRHVIWPARLCGACYQKNLKFETEKRKLELI